MTKPKTEWVQSAKEAMEHAYIPYSNFPVGASLITEDGEIYQGANLENASYGLTICAERSAIFKAVFDGKRKFTHMVVVGNTPDPISPCGACRQVMAEFFDPEMSVTLIGANDVTQETTMKELLPFAFTSKDL